MTSSPLVDGSSTTLALGRSQGEAVEGRPLLPPLEVSASVWLPTPTGGSSSPLRSTQALAKVCQSAV